MSTVTAFPLDIDNLKQVEMPNAVPVFEKYTINDNQNRYMELNGIGMKYQSPSYETAAVENVSFHVERGEFISIVGPSGCGKSTLLSIIAGLLPDYTGEIKINNNLIKGTAPEIGYMFQNDQLFEWRSVWGNAILGLEIRRMKTRENIEYVKHLLKTYGLYEFKDKRPSELSGGMRQRAALIRTLAVKPEILLLDEAFSALDYQTRLAVCEDVYKIIKNEGKTVILVTHDISESISMSDRVIVLSRRPAAIRAIHDIRFSLAGRTPLLCREAPEFRSYFNRIWKELDIHM